MFALEPIREGETVVVWGGKLFTREDVKLGKAAKGSVSAVDEGLYLAGDVNEFPPDPSNFMNHSCDPNVCMKDEITLGARRDIEKGEELTGDYAQCGRLTNSTLRAGHVIVALRYAERG